MGNRLERVERGTRETNENITVVVKDREWWPGPWWWWERWQKGTRGDAANQRFSDGAVIPLIFDNV